MTDIVERVARVLSTVPGLPRSTMIKARAVLHALREASDDMVAAGSVQDGAAATWVAMIDIAIASEDKTRKPRRLPDHLREMSARRVIEHHTVDPETGCWMWNHRVDKHGYGRIALEQRVWLAHRVAYEALVGPIPEGLVLDHLCRRRGCVNPEHLEPVTMKENTRRGISPATISTTRPTCINGHPRSPENTYNSGTARHCRLCNRDSRARSVARKRSAAPFPQGTDRGGIGL